MNRLAAGALCGFFLALVVLMTNHVWFGLALLVLSIVAGLGALVHTIRHDRQGENVILSLLPLVLTVLLVPAVAFLARPKEDARRGACANQLGQIGKSMAAYSNTSGDYWPYDARGPLHSLALLYPRWMDDARVFVCPKVWDEEMRAFPAGTVPGGRPCSYGYDHLAALDAMRPDSPRAADMPGNHGEDGINVLFWDGHVSFIGPRYPLPADDNIFTRDPDKNPDEDAFVRQ